MSQPEGERPAPPARHEPPPARLVLRRIAGALVLVAVVGLTTCSGLWSAAFGATSAPTQAPAATPAPAAAGGTAHA